ncbi:restriction endonuclease [Sulfuricaulis limicola]|uniref:Restriction endonuclease n=1 Tax=Sulfuricaulis limicola TaxID=1620215 RepID=A0A1B4XIZ2_9GAMM|nr:type II restriction endonuclease [Sulfuricaulis limicola]BAV34770.1 restriction endonuclease [Sulfuricaulis limicola]
MDEEEVLEALKESFDIPGGSEITAGAMKQVLGKKVNDKEWIKKNFSDLIEEIQLIAYDHYLRAERPAGADAFRKVFTSLLPEKPVADDFFNLLEKNFWALDRFFLGLTQGRRPRAGKAFEHVINKLFTTLGYPYTSQPIINGQPDFLLPSIEHYRHNAMDCIIFTVKRSLRERWRQIVTEGTRGHMFFLATIDEGIGERDLADMLKNRIYLVMPERIRAAHYPKSANVISFEAFFQHHLDPAMARWRANGVIK